MECWHWDVSESHSINVVPWPDEQAVHLEVLHHIATESQITIKVSKDQTFRGVVDLVTFARCDSSLLHIALRLPRKPKDEAYVTAKSLALQWDLPLDKLDQWKAQIDKGTLRPLLIVNTKVTPSISLEIFPGLDANHSFGLQFVIGWGMVQVHAPATTQAGAE